MREPVSVVLGIDVGSTNTKVVVVAVDAEGAVQERAVRAVPTADDPAELLAAVEPSIEAVVAEAEAVPQAVGIASMAETGVPLDGRGAPLGPLRTWRGAAAEADDALMRVLADPVRFTATGVPATPKPALVALARLRRDDPALAARLHRWAGAADLVAAALTGRLGTDHTLALRTGGLRLPPPGEPLPHAYDRDLLAPFGVGADVLPPIAPAGAVLGPVTRQAAGRTGLAPGTPVAVAGHDHLVGAWAAGVRAPGRVADSLGTAEAVVRLLDRPVDRSAVAGTGSSIVRAVDGRSEAVLTASTGAGAAVRAWYGGAAPDGVFAAAARLLPDPGEALVVLPYPAGRQAPEPDPRATLRLVSLRGEPVDAAEVPAPHAARALLLGLALQARWMDDEQRRLTGSGVQPWTVLGGAGAANAAWLALKAAVAPAPVGVVTAAEPVAAGAALLGGVRAGVLPDHVRLPVRALPAGPAAGLDRLLAAFRDVATRTAHEGAA